MRKRLKEFEQQASPLRGSLLAQAILLTRNFHDADDLVQETYLRAYRKFHLYQQGTNLRAWMGRIMRNEFINSLRGKKAQFQRKLVEPQNCVVPVEHEPERTHRFNLLEPEQLMESDDFLQLLDADLKAGLEDLSEPYRDALLSRAISGASYREVAEKLNIPIGTVMSRLKRARDIMKEHAPSMV